MMNQLLKSVFGSHYPHVQALFQRRRTGTTTHTDPVCGMSVGEPPAGGTSEYQGTTYYFCSSGCKARFDRNPVAYVRATK
jgi:YHS domain-containing protein